MTQTTSITSNSNSTSSSNATPIPSPVDENNSELNEYLKKLMQLIPYLKNVQSNDTEAVLLSATKKLESFQYLSLNNDIKPGSQTISTTTTVDTNTNSISDLQILQSALDYILDLQDEIIYLNNEDNQ